MTISQVRLEWSFSCSCTWYWRLIAYEWLFSGLVGWWGHWRGMYGQLKDEPLSSMSLIKVSMGVFPTSRTKNNCSITCDETDRNEGNRRSSLPNLVGWFGYWVRQYSSNAHWLFSCSDSMWLMSVKPHASVGEGNEWNLVSIFGWNILFRGG